MPAFEAERECTGAKRPPLLFAVLMLNKNREGDMFKGIAARAGHCDWGLSNWNQYILHVKIIFKKLLKNFCWLHQAESIYVSFFYKF
jgi:hypothetical protein